MEPPTMGMQWAYQCQLEIYVGNLYLVALKLPDDALERKIIDVFSPSCQLFFDQVLK